MSRTSGRPETAANFGQTDIPSPAYHNAIGQLRRTLSTSNTYDYTNSNGYVGGGTGNHVTSSVAQNGVYDTVANSSYNTQFRVQKLRHCYCILYL